MRKLTVLWPDMICLVAFILIVITMSGCTASGVAVPASIAPTINKLDMYGTINGYAFEGVGVVPAAKNYDMRIQSDADINLLTVATCHRNFSVEDAIKTGWFETNRGFEYQWTPAPGIEDTGSCLMRIGSYNKSVGGQNAWAIVDLCTNDMVLPALNECDGAQGQSHGCSICQTKNGLIERLVFDTPVKVELKDLTPNCTGTLSADGKTWEYVMGLGECVQIFAEIAKPHRMHRHTTEGYNNILYRGGN